MALGSVKPGAHDVTAHCPPVQVVPVAFAGKLVQLTMQLPQLRTVSSGVSQPFESMPSQLPQPGSHGPSWHVPPTHTPVALV
jgi:hypothetical protein